MFSRGVCLALAIAMTLPAAGRAQDTTRVSAGTIAADTLSADTLGPSPRTAFIRSLIVPGWGQSMVGAYFRGGVFFTLEGGSWYMLLKTLGKLASARQRERGNVDFATDSLRGLMADDTAAARRLSDPATFQQAIDDNQAVVDARALVDSRRQQRQDWITYTVFFTMAGAADAYVAAHLATFPVDITAQPEASGGLRLEVAFPVGRRR